MTTALDRLVVAPLLPLWLLALVAALLGAGLVLVVVRARRLVVPRALVAALLLLVLANPVDRIERRAERPDVGIAIVDRTASMGIGERSQQAAKALAALQDQSPGIAWRVVAVDQQPGAPTRLAQAIERAGFDAPPGRTAGIVVLTDGISADAPDPRQLPAGVPLHLLIAGDPATADRRLIVRQVPGYSVSGRRAKVVIEVDDGNGGGTATLTRQIAGDRATVSEVAVGKPVTLDIPVDRRGMIEVALSVAARPGGEVTLINNRALVRLNGVNDRLRVLLVSGVPYPGGRVWRDILKSDANVDLVHFTILRLPSSFDITPPEQMSLIPFPVEELFEEHLPDFDLIIFDRFGLSELLAPLYFQELGDRVRKGGGLLVVAGDEFDAPGGLAGTALADLLPVRPAGPAVTAPFRPALTAVGVRHPVTAELPAAWGGIDWGRWGSQSDVAPVRGQVLMKGADERPLLILDRVDAGRVGVIASTNVWWWSRGVDGGGPQVELLRRTAHWLMREPDLDENQLAFAARGRTLTATARGVDPPATGTLVDPAGNARDVRFTATADGSATARIEVTVDGLYQFRAGGRTRFTLAGDTREFAEVRPRTAPLEAAAKASGGGTYWLADGVPRVRRVDPGDVAAGRRWLGLVRNRAGTIVAVDTRPLIAPPLALLLIVGALIFAWWRERA